MSYVTKMAQRAAYEYPARRKKSKDTESPESMRNHYIKQDITKGVPKFSKPGVLSVSTTKNYSVESNEPRFRRKSPALASMKASPTGHFKWT